MTRWECKSNKSLYEQVGGGSTVVIPLGDFLRNREAMTINRSN